MREGRLAEPIFKRSVMRQLKSVGKAADGIINLPEGALLSTAVCSYTINAKKSIWFVINAAVNKLAVTGAQPVAVALSVFLPEELEEKDLKEMMCTDQNAPDSFFSA